MALEAQLVQQQREMTIERDRLRDENAALIRAMASLASDWNVSSQLYTSITLTLTALWYITNRRFTINKTFINK